MDVKKTVEFYLPHYEIIWPVWGALARVPINAPIILESCLNEKHSAKEKKYWWNKLQNIFTIYNEEDGIEHQDYRLLDRYYKWAFISSISLFTVFTKISK